MIYSKSSQANNPEPSKTSPECSSKAKTNRNSRRISRI